MSSLLQVFNEARTVLYYATAVGFGLVHIVFAWAVFRDARRLALDRTAPALVPAWVWALTVLVGGVLPAGLYWFIHHSSLRPKSSTPTDL